MGLTSSKDIAISETFSSASQDQVNEPKVVSPPPPLWFTREFYFYYVVFGSVVTWMCYCGVYLSSDTHEAYFSYKDRLSPGWFFGRLVDDSDTQLRTFRNNAKNIGLVMVLHLVLSYSVRWLSQKFGYDPQNKRKTGFRSLFFSPRLSLSLVFSLLLLYGLHGYDTLKILVVVSLNYQLSKLTRRSRVNPFLTWSYNLTILLLSSKIQSTKFGEFSTNLKFLDNFSGILPRWHIHYNITMLRVMSFNLDYYWSSPAQLETPSSPTSSQTTANKPLLTTTKQRVLHSWPSEVYCYSNYLAYLFYPPLYLAGPIITFNDFMHQMFYLNPAVTLKGTFLYFIRLLGCILLGELMLHYVYVQAIAKSGDFEHFTPAQLLMIGYFNLKFIWLKLLIIWRFFRFWAMADGIDVVENMRRCMSNNYSVQGFWKGWHCSYNRWLVRYLYIPLGGARLAFVNIWIIFTFVALWHDTELRLLAWGWLIALFFLPEMIAGKLSNSLADKFYYRHLCALGGAMNMVVLAVANLVGFALGIDGLKRLLSEMCTLPGFFSFLFVMFCFFITVQIMKEIREEENRNLLDSKSSKQI